MDCANVQCRMQSRWRRLLRRKQEGTFVEGRWYCGMECFEDAVTQAFAQMVRVPDEPLKRLYRVPLGLVLLGRGVITDEQLKRALQAQRETGKDRLGRWLVRLNLASTQDISMALASQWGCGVFPLDRDRRYRECSQLLPLAILESSRMLPVHFLGDTNLLFLAFSEDIDHTAIYATERLLGSRTQPCVVTEAAMELALDEIRNTSRPSEIVFETIWQPTEMAHVVRDYALKIGAEELALARPRGFLWARLKTAQNRLDMMFRLPAAPMLAAAGPSAGVTAVNH